MPWVFSEYFSTPVKPFVKIMTWTWSDVIVVLETMNPVIALFASFAGASLIGAVPRLGPGRAVVLAVRSRVLPIWQKRPISIREPELKTLFDQITMKQWDPSYMVITGEKGAGKSCFVETATLHTAGVIKFEVNPGDSEKEIVTTALRKITNHGISFWDQSANARRIIFWYKLITLGRTPIVVINATERKQGQEYASLTGAVRTLTGVYNLRVIVDGSPNSLDEHLFRTMRGAIIDIKSMTREMIWSLPQFQNVFQLIDKAKLGDVVWQVLGGVPARYIELGRIFSLGSIDDQTVRRIVGEYLCTTIYEAIRVIKTGRLTEPSYQTIIDHHFNTLTGEIDIKELEIHKLKRPSPDKIFREVKHDGLPVLVPASNAIRIVLCHKLEKEPTLEELSKMTSLDKELEKVELDKVVSPNPVK
jgi:hypothetical protein